MTALGFEHEDFLLPAAPKPVMAICATYDFFPVEGTRKTIENLKEIWKLYGKEENISLYEEKTEHIYTRKMAKKAAEFFSKHLNGTEVSPSDEGTDAILPSKLWCTQRGIVTEEIPGAKTIHDEVLARLWRFKQQRLEMSEAQRKNYSINWLNEKIWNGRDRRALNTRHICLLNVGELLVRTDYWFMEQDLSGHSISIRDCRYKGEKLPVTFAVWNRGTTELTEHMWWIRKQCAEGREVVINDIIGDGNLEPNKINWFEMRGFYGTIYKLSDDLLWLGDSLAALRVFGIVRAVDALYDFPDIDTEDIRYYASGT